MENILLHFGKGICIINQLRSESYSQFFFANAFSISFCNVGNYFSVLSTFYSKFQDQYFQVLA